MAEETVSGNVSGNILEDLGNTRVHMVGRGQVPVRIVLSYVRKGDHAIFIKKGGAMIGGTIDSVGSEHIIVHSIDAFFCVSKTDRVRITIGVPPPREDDSEVCAIIVNDPCLQALGRDDTAETA